MPLGPRSRDSAEAQISHVPYRGRNGPCCPVTVRSSFDNKVAVNLRVAAMTRVRAARSLNELQGQFRQMSEQAAALGRRADAVALGHRPGPGRWSAAECLAHLNLSVDPYLPLWRQVLAQDSRTGFPTRDRYSLDIWGRILVWTLEPPPRLRSSTPRRFDPVNTDPVPTILPGFLDRQHVILEALESAHGNAIDTIKIVSPFDSRVRYSIWSSLCVTAAHQRRHLWQAERALPVPAERSGA